MHAGHGVDGRAPQRVAQHVGLDGRSQRHVETNAFFPSGTHDSGKTFTERTVDEGQSPPAHAIAHGHFHESGRRIGPDEHRAIRARQRAQFGGDALQQFFHGRRAVPDHRPYHGLEHLGMNVGRTGKEELSEGSRQRGGRRHALARASSSTKPPITTSLVLTRRTPASPHSFSRWAATSRSIGFIASTTAKMRVCGRCCSSPSIAYLSQTSSATPYRTMSCGSSTSRTGRTWGLEKTSKRCL